MRNEEWKTRRVFLPFLIPHSSLIVKGWRWRLSAKLNVLTGATGLLGSHIAEQLVERGERVRALVRPTSDTTFLRGLGVELAQGDLADAASLRRAVAGADGGYHRAAQGGGRGAGRALPAPGGE